MIIKDPNHEPHLGALCNPIFSPLPFNSFSKVFRVGLPLLGHPAIAPRRPHPKMVSLKHDKFLNYL